MNTKRLIQNLLGITIWVMVFSVTVSAQPGTGKLTGKVTDSSTNRSLAGVSIVPEGTSKGIATINDGTYILTLPAGTYTIRYSYSSYATKEISEIVIKKGETSFLDVNLSPRPKTLTGVTVTATARREAQSAVYNRQRLSTAASDGISQEAISKTPDNNAGQILRRVTGVSVQNEKFVVVRGLGAQYNQTMLNGVAMTSTETNQNAFSFDLIPAAAIDNITVNKTATPDMPGNFAGGVVQVNTKDFPAKDFYSIALQTGFSEKTIGKDFLSDKRGKMEWLGFGGSSRDLPKGFPVATDRVSFLNLNPQEVLRYQKQLKNNLAPINYGASGHNLSNVNESIQFGFGKTIRLKNSQFGIVAALTQRKTELIEMETTIRDATVASLNVVAVQNLVSLSSINTRYRYSAEMSGVLNIAYSFGSNKITFKNLYSQVFRNNYIKRDSVVFLSSAGLYDNPGKFGVQGFSYYTEQRNILNSVLSGEHRTGLNKETLLDWNVNVTTNSSKFPDTRNFIFNTDDQGKFFTPSAGISVPLYLTIASRLWTSVDDLITGGSFNLSTVFELFKAKQTLKGGILFQNRKRSALATALPIEVNNHLPLDSILNPSGYSLVTAVGEYFQKVGNYNANTSLQAAYESLENRFGKNWRVIWGIRFENYQQSSSVYQPLYDPQFNDPELTPLNFSSRTVFNFLPSINVIYSPARSINFRAAFSKTVIRPDLRDIIGATRFDFQTFQLNTGNPELRSTAITNYDLKFEWFPAAGEIFSVGAFYKKLIDPIEYGQVTEENTFIGRLAINTGDAYVRGVEAEIRKRINFISFAPWLKNVTLFGNGSLLHSEVKDRVIYNNFLDFSPKHSLTGQPKYIANAGISIAAFKNTFEATFSYNRTGDYIDQLGSSRYSVNQPYGKPLLLIPNYILLARDVIDVSVRQALLQGKGLLKFNISNLLSKPLTIYQDYNGNNKLDEAIKISRLSGQYGFITSGIDNVSSLTIGQRTYSLSLSYTF